MTLFDFSPAVATLFGAALCTFGFVIAGQAPRRCVWYAILVGVAGQAASQAVRYMGYTPEAAAFAGGLTVGVMAEIGARIFRAPVTVFTITGFIPLVPGTLSFRSVATLLDNQYIEAVVFALRTLTIGGAIAVGLAVPTAFHQIGVRQRRKSR
jgi:uncharacterized membrane protein YjjB (DUF3815 family)